MMTTEEKTTHKTGDKPIRNHINNHHHHIITRMRKFTTFPIKKFTQPKMVLKRELLHADVASFCNIQQFCTAQRADSSGKTLTGCVMNIYIYNRAVI